MQGILDPPLSGYIDLNPTETYQSQTTCDQQLEICQTYFWGNLTGGTGAMSVTLPDNSVITLTAFSIRGGFFGEICNCSDEFDQSSDYTFVGYWSNGWFSKVSGYDDWDLFYNGSGTMQITTETTPEPTTLALLGSGLLGLIGYGRKRLGSS